MFQIVVLISLLVIILTPFNQIGQPFQNVTKTGFEYGYQYVTFDGSSLNSANIGDRLNFYRFNPEWYQPIG
ncbi:hypothetical protein [Marinicellulosiphila megalodicopiae]|uniref:hypothetical protein n=1 Tax=Marinicellulosiphila megalodicopiae TaxID=2724896 RepID=UPI003BB188E7